MILREALERLSGDPVLVAGPARSVRREALLGRGAPERLRGLRVGLCQADPSDALEAMAALDGTVAALAPVSAALDPEDVTAQAAHAALDAVICDDPQAYPPARGVRFVAGVDALPDGPDGPGGPTDWILHTSGTTGTPKQVVHSLEGLTRTARTAQAGDGAVRWGMVYDHTRFAGLQVLLQSALSGATLIAPDQDAPLEEKVALFADRGCTHLSGTPTLWRKIMMIPGAERIPLRQATLGGEIADDRVLRSLAAFYPQARVTHIFASTEAGVGFSVKDGRAGFPRAFLDDPPQGVGIRVEDGRLLVRNESVRPRYLNSDTAFADGDGWVETGDAVEVTEDRVLFLGRANGVINIGGDKVHPEEVEAALMEHDLVSRARVYAKRNPITGALVAADVALADAEADPGDARRELRTWLAGRLARHKVPAFLAVVEDFDVNAAGKLVRK